MKSRFKTICRSECPNRLKSDFLSLQVGYRPDSTKLNKGDVEDAVDLSLGYSGRSKFLGDRDYTIRIIARNLFPDDDRLTPTAIDTLTGGTITSARLNGRQLVVSFELKM